MTSATRTTEQEILDLERQYWECMKARDVEGAVALTEDPCIVAGSSGVASVAREMFTGMMEGADWRIHDVDIDRDAIVRMITNDVAIVAYKVREDLTVGGDPVTLNAADTSVWVRRDGAWRCALHTESVLGDAYGRDRKPVSG